MSNISVMLLVTQDQLGKISGVGQTHLCLKGVFYYLGDN